MRTLPHIAARVFNTPLLLEPAKAEVILSAVGDRLGVNSFTTIDGLTVPVRGPAMQVEDEGYLAADRENDGGYDVVKSIAVVEVAGTLVQKSGYLRPCSGMTGYDGIRQNYITALNDSDVKAIAVDINSPGGEVPGCFDLVDLIYETRGEKPVWAICNEYAYSAAYALASACDYITVPRTGGVGSVGAVWIHMDFSQAISDAGVKVTLVKYGDRKMEGNPYEAMSKPTQERFQKSIDMVGELFVDTVARNRGISAKKVRDTEAGCFLAAEGVELGLADSVMAPDAAFRALLKKIA
jgi:signal peptide peptidase SppA